MSEQDEVMDVLKRLTLALEQQGGNGQRAEITVREACAGFLAALEARGRAEATIKSYRQRLGQFVNVYGDLDVADVLPEHVDQWIIDMRRQSEKWADHPKRPAESGRLSAVTINNRIQAIKAFFRWCGRRGYLDEEPARDLKRERPRDRTRQAMHPDDLQAMLRAAKDKAEAGRPRDLALLLFLADTGCRVGEVVNLELAELDLEELEAVVDGKTGRGRVDFTRRTAEALRDWLRVRPDHVDHGLVFTNAGANFGRRLSTDSVYQVLRRLAERAGVKRRYNPHAIRHLVGQRFTDEGNLELARQKLRHSSITTTADYYANQDRERLKRATAELSLAADFSRGPAGLFGLRDEGE